MKSVLKTIFWRGSIFLSGLAVLGFGVRAKDVPGVRAYYWGAVSDSYISPIWLALYGSDQPLWAEERAAKAELLLQRQGG
jgi:hypothetical protein